MRRRISRGWLLSEKYSPEVSEGARYVYEDRTVEGSGDPVAGPEAFHISPVA